MALGKKGFQKGHPCFNNLKGKKLSKEHVEKLSQIRLKNPNRYWKGKRRKDMEGKNNPMYKPKAKIICQHCFKEFEVQPCHKNTAKYCSFKCFSKYKVGKNTGIKKGYKYGPEHKPWNFNNYSSFEPYGIEFNNKLKLKIRQRDKHLCQLCTSKKDLLIHHKDKNKKNNQIDNLITLCRSCHSKYHNNLEGTYFKILKGLEVEII